METWLPVVLAALFGTGGVAALLRVRSLNRNTDVSTEGALAAAITQSYVVLVGQLNARIDDLQVEHEQCKKDLGLLKDRLDGVEALTGSSLTALETKVVQLLDQRIRRPHG